MEEKLFEEFSKLDLFKEDEDIINDLIDYVIDDVKSGYTRFAVDSAVHWCKTELGEHFDEEELEYTFQKIFKKFSDDGEEHSNLDKNNTIDDLKKVIDLNKVYNCFSDIDIPTGSKGYFSNFLYNIAIQIKENSKKHSLEKINTTSNEESVFKSSDGSWYSYFYCTSVFKYLPLDYSNNLVGKTFEMPEKKIRSTILSQDETGIYVVNGNEVKEIKVLSYEYIMNNNCLINGNKCQKVVISE